MSESIYSNRGLFRIHDNTWRNISMKVQESTRKYENYQNVKIKNKSKEKQVDRSK